MTTDSYAAASRQTKPLGCDDRAPHGPAWPGRVGQRLPDLERRERARRTGALVPVEVKRRCTRFGFKVADTITEGARLYLWDDLGFQDTPELSQDVPFPQLAAVSGSRDTASIANTLLLFTGRA